VQLILKPGKERSLIRRHPWLYAGAIAREVGKPALGDTVAVHGADGKFLAWAAFSPASTIRARVWSVRESEKIDDAFFEQRLRTAISQREMLAERTSARRLVFGEADGLPGLVVDRYADYLVAQFLAAGVERHKSAIADALVRITGCQNVYERSDAAVRTREGLPEIEGVLRGEAPPDRIQVQEDGVQYWIDVFRGHKTGFYIDQRESRALVRRLIGQMGPGRRVLNCFSYTGGFSLAALAGGAQQAISVDSSGDALAMASANVALNGFDPARAPMLDENVFDALKRFEKEGERFDVIVLDPPKFAPSSQHLIRASRAYKDLNMRGLRLLNEGGYLLTYSCSGAVNLELFQQIVAGAVIDARVDAQLVQRLTAGWDHPMAMVHPEGEYLKGLCLRIGKRDTNATQ
jgi:23S rRNA (cytosine1962-C5)-methyltransferase